MKYLLIIVIALTLTACDKTYVNSSDKFLLPPEMSDCKIYTLQSVDGVRLNVIRCPNSTTTTSHLSGKVQVSNVVIDGIEYQKVKVE